MGKKSPFKEMITLKAKYLPKKMDAIVYGKKHISWKDLNTRINKLAYGLKKLGYKFGDKIAVDFHNSPYFVESVMAIQSFGGIPVLINYRYVSSELEYVLNNSDSICIIFEEDVLDVVLQTQPNVPKIKNYICKGEKIPSGVLNYESLIRKSKDKEPKVKIKPDEDVAVIVYTGGTTGRPKGVMLTYENILFNQESLFSFLIKTLPHARQLDSDREIKKLNKFQKKVQEAFSLFGSNMINFITDTLKDKIVVFHSKSQTGPSFPPITITTVNDKMRLFRDKPKNFDLLFDAKFTDQLRDFVKIIPLTFSKLGKLKLFPKIMKMLLGSGAKMEGKGKYKRAVISGLTHKPKIERNMNILVIPPLFHSAAFGVWLVNWGFNPVSEVLFPMNKKFSVEETLDLIDKENVYWAFLVPVMWQEIVTSPLVTNGNYDLSKLIVASSGGSLLRAKYKKMIMQTFSNALLVDGFGLTEMSPITSIKLDAEEDVVKNRSIGKILDGIEVKIINPDTGEELKEGETGELCYRSPSVMKGYYGDEEKTKKAIDKEGWLHSGDLGYIKEGEIYIVERIKACINTGGEKVYPLEVEEVIHDHPAVDEVIVIGVPDEKWGESVRAVVQLKPGQSATEEEIIEFCRGKIAGFKKPKSVIFAKDLPITAVGKVQRGEVTKLYGKPE